MQTIIHGGWTIIQNIDNGLPEARRDLGVLVEDGLIVEVDRLDHLRRKLQDVPVSGSSNYLLMPGLINAHHHVGLTPVQLGSPDLPLELWWASRIGARSVDLRLDTLYSAFEMVASGVTTVQHLHGRVGGLLENMIEAANTVIGAYKDIGMRVSYSMGFRDQNRLVYEDDEVFFACLPEGLAARLRTFYAAQQVGLQQHETFIRELLSRHRDDSTVRIQLAPANLHWCSDDALTRLSQLSEILDLPMHMHLDETVYQREYARRRTGSSAIAFLETKGMLNPRMTVGHAVWSTRRDIDLIARRGVRICCNCSSNLRLKSGIAPLNAFTEAAVPVALGIDEAGINDDRDMLQEMRVVLRVNREPGIDNGSPSPAQVLQMATTGGASTTSFGDNIGCIKPGSAADLVFLDWNGISYPYLNPSTSPIDALVLRAKGAHVKMVMVAGKEIYRDGVFLAVNKHLILDQFAQLMSSASSETEADRASLASEIMPYVKGFYESYLRTPKGNSFYSYNSKD